MMPTYMSQPTNGPYNSSYGTNAFNAGPMNQSTMPSSPPNYFGGRLIEDFTEVKPNETPMDGSITLFPTKDLNSIYLRTWNRDGRLMSFVYRLDTSVDLNAPVLPPQQQEYQALIDRVNQLEDMVRQQQTPAPAQQSRGGRNSNRGEEAKS